MDELKSHIFVKHPDRKQITCWSCGAKKGDHEYFVHPIQEIITVSKTRRKGNARSVRSKTPGIRAVR